MKALFLSHALYKALTLIAVMGLSTSVLAQVPVSGKVTAQESGSGLPGVNVLLKGTTLGTTTNADGQYTLSIPGGGGTLVFSFISYVTEEVPVNNRSVIDISLVPDIKALNEVVVVGYGTQKRGDVTGSVASVSAEKIRNIPAAGLDQKLAGQLAGVQVSQTNGAPGAGVTVRVRGTGSIGAGNEPLYVIDGFPIEQSYDHDFNPLNTINPGDIESIEVLKDASATAIYGSRGANGVVLITTKTGKAGAAKIELDVYTGLQEVINKIDLMNAREYAEMSVEARNRAHVQGGGSATDPNEVRDVGNRIPPAFQDLSGIGEGTDWQDAIFRVAPTQNYMLTASGGTEKPGT